MRIAAAADGASARAMRPATDWCHSHCGRPAGGCCGFGSTSWHRRAKRSCSNAFRRHSTPHPGPDLGRGGEGEEVRLRRVLPPRIGFSAVFGGMDVAGGGFGGGHPRGILELSRGVRSASDAPPGRSPLRSDPERVAESSRWAVVSRTPPGCCHLGVRYRGWRWRSTPG
ncbi:MAG: hypothetical protein RL514_2381 [Verrucomicrobiota bacterium]|jgi:hypothetical protein